MKQGNSLVTLVIVLLAVMLAAYLGVYAWDSFTDPFTTTLTYSYTANDSLEADGWVVREEQLLPAQSGILDLPGQKGRKWAGARLWLWSTRTARRWTSRLRWRSWPWRLSCWITP